jgi:hypothetical protein
MFIPDPDFFLSIPDPKTTTKERDKKNFWTFFCSHKNHKIKKLSLALKNMGFGSGKNLFRIPDPAPQHC